MQTFWILLRDVIKLLGFTVVPFSLPVFPRWLRLQFKQNGNTSSLCQNLWDAVVHTVIFHQVENYRSELQTILHSYDTLTAGTGHWKTSWLLSSCRIHTLPKVQHASCIRYLELTWTLLHPLQNQQHNPILRSRSTACGWHLKYQGAGWKIASEMTQQWQWFSKQTWAMCLTSLSRIPSSTIAAKRWHRGSLLESGDPISTPSSRISPPFLSARSSTC
jgi:hypothetical protein